MNTLAITDHGNMFGAIDFYTACKDVGVKPIIGMEVYMAMGSHLDKSAKRGEKVYTHLTLLAKNNQGYKNLIQLATIGYTEGFYYKPRIDMKLLEKHKGGIICLSGCLFGEISQLILSGKIPQAVQVAQDLKKLFSEDFYLEIQDFGLPEQQILRENLPDMSYDLKVPIVATNDIHYVNKEDSYAHEALLCIGTGTNIYDEKRLRFPSSELYMKSADDMWGMWPRDFIEPTQKIADECNVEIALGRTFHIFEPESSFKKMKEVCDNAIKKLPEKYKDRYLYEVEVIKRTDYAEYLMVVADFVKFAKDSGIPIGSGRGSSAGSLVCYLLGITDIDPIAYGLLFERFINTDRVEPPDIDIDVCQTRRGEIIEYVKKQYGEDRVAQIVTFGSMKTRGVIKDVCRVLQFPFGLGDEISKKLGDHWDGNVLETLNRVDITHILDRHMEISKQKEFIDVAIKIEGRLRHSSTHAAGIVISDKPLLEVAPLYKRVGSDDILTQYDMNSISKLGLLKFDILGLRTLTVIDTACKLAGVNPVDIPLDDYKVYDLISKGHTAGIFQYEGWGYTQFIKRMKPRTFSDLIALGALYRPGPLNSGMADTYIKRMHDRDPGTDPILEETYGIMLYQEQIMQIVVRDAGFTMNEADTLRKAIGKKDQDLMDKMLPKIKDPLLKGNIITFARYGWNKAHAVSYAILSYKTAWLRFNYPTEFWCAELNSEINNNKRLPYLLKEARFDGVEMESPHINLSDKYYTMHANKLYAGLLAIKGIGQKACDSILENRKTNGIFRSADTFRERMPPKLVNKTAFEVLKHVDVFREVAEPEIHTRADTEFELYQLKEMANKYPGNYRLYVHIGDKIIQTKTYIDKDKINIKG